jgi:Bacterial Ig domain
MNHRYFRKQACVYFIAATLWAVTMFGVANSAEITITAPRNGATISATTTVRSSTASNVSWLNYYVDGRFAASKSHNSSAWNWDTTQYSEGRHTVSAHAYSSSRSELGTDSANVTVANNTEACNGGHLAGRGLMSDSQAAGHVLSAPKSVVETGAAKGSAVAAANATANAYYYNHGNSSTYAHQLAIFHSAWKGDGIMQRVDGACRLGRHPTTAEILQWAAHKWGFSSLVAYAEATDDGSWNMTKLGDDGCSIGVAQVAYCNNASHPNHAIQGLKSGSAGHLLPKENTCFNVDLFAAFLYKHYTRGCGRGDLPVAIQQWQGPSYCAPAHFAHVLCNDIATHDWDRRFFNGDPVPY